MANTYVHSVTLPCSIDALQCPPPIAKEPICDGTSNFEVANDIFDTPEDTDTWLFSMKGTNGALGKYLDPTLGTSKTFRVPMSANNLTVTMEVFELNCINPTDVSILVGDVFVYLGKPDCNVHEPKRFVSNAVSVEIISEAPRADKVVLVIPSEFYGESGRLRIGLRSDTIGVASFTMTADCSDSVPIWQDPDVLSIIEQVVVP